MEHLRVDCLVALTALLFFGGCEHSQGDIGEAAEKIESVTHSVISSSPNILFSSKVDCTRSQVLFSFSMKNQSSEDLEISSASLPWDTATLANSWEVNALPDKRRVARQFFGSDHAPGPVFLSPGESMSGKLNLTELFPELVEALQSGDVEITHSYWLQLPKRSEDGDVFERVLVKRGWCAGGNKGPE